MGDSLGQLNAALQSVLTALDALQAYNERAASGGFDPAERGSLWQKLVEANREYAATIDAILKRPRNL